jgi:hypothetical protein
VAAHKSDLVSNPDNSSAEPHRRTMHRPPILSAKLRRRRHGNKQLAVSRDINRRTRIPPRPGPPRSSTREARLDPAPAEDSRADADASACRVKAPLSLAGVAARAVPAPPRSKMDQTVRAWLELPGRPAMI